MLKKNVLITLLVVLYLLPLTHTYAQVWTGDYIIENQADVDSFPINCNCTEITGNLDIDRFDLDSDITNLDGLSNLTTIGGGANISSNPLLENLDGLNNLTNVGDNFRISDNDDITNLDGLNNLTNVGGDFGVSGNDGLTNIDGLNELSSVGGDFYISNSDALTTIGGFNKLISIGETISFYSNELLLNIEGFDKLAIVGDNFDITDNGSLTEFNSFNSLIEIENYLIIRSNNALTSILGFNSLERINDNLYIRNHPVLASINGLIDLEFIGGYLELDNNPSLTDCCIVEYWYVSNVVQGIYIIADDGNNGFNCNSLAQIQDSCEDPEPAPFLRICNSDYTLTSQAEIDGFLAETDSCEIINGNITIIEENAGDITNLNGLSELLIVNGTIFISGNSALTDISGLSGIAYVTGNLFIGDNLSLAECCIAECWNIYDVVQGSYNIAFDANVRPNAAGCNSLNDIESSCDENTCVPVELPSCVSDFLVTRQGEIDSFYTNTGGCLIIDGNFTIREAVSGDITNLDGLSHLIGITRNLIIEKNAALSNLDGLSSLGTVGKDITIFKNSSLTNLDGLSHLNTIKNILTIRDNDALPIIEGFENLSTLGGLAIRDNFQLIEVSGFENIFDLEYLLDIRNNKKLANITEALKNLRTVDGNIDISVNDSLKVITALDSLRVVDGNFIIKANATLENIIGFDNLQLISGDFIIKGNEELLTIDGFNELTEVTELPVFAFFEDHGLVFIDNTSLLSITGFNKLERIGQDFEIKNSPDLSEISSFSQFTEVEYFFRIENTGLSSLTGFNNLSQVYGLDIKNNPLLTDISGFTNLTSTTFGSFVIESNSSLTNIDGFTKLGSVGSFFVINDNASLTTIDNFISLTIIENSLGIDFAGLEIANNPVLTNIDGFPNIEHISGLLFIRGNQALSACCLVECWYENDIVKGDYYIGVDYEGNTSLNSLNCNSLNEILDDCNKSEGCDNSTATSNTVQLKAILSGAYDNGEMTTNLADVLPNNQPYINHPAQYSGDESVADFSENVVDWVLVEVRDDDYNIVETRAVLLRNDGILVDIDESEEVKFYTLNANETYYFVIRHRNHMDVISENKLSLNNTNPHDFTNATNISGGTQQLTNLGDGTYGLLAGDINGDGAISIADYNIYTSEASTISSYVNSDCNLDRNVTASDFNLYKPNAAKIGATEIRY